MIFCTTGTTRFPFKRLLLSLDKALKDKKERLILQVSDNNQQLRYAHVQTYNELSFRDMMLYMSNARAVICHGGAGTLLLALHYAKVKPLVIPRCSNSHEHIDNHQVFFSSFVHSLGFSALPNDSRPLSQEIQDYINAPPKKTHHTNNARLLSLITRLNAFTDGFQKNISIGE